MLVGVLFNIILHVVNSELIYRLTFRIFKSREYAYRVAKYFALTPSLLYHVNFYSESLFCFGC